ncbi:hypothetical protein GF325_07355 [Candidatus Bathyarchaeota archaeon]|nr:hypothetical protein [Candidatus Bathyarchaeota archaeon]
MSSPCGFSWVLLVSPALPLRLESARYIVPGAPHGAVTSIARPGNHWQSSCQAVYGSTATSCIQQGSFLSHSME